ncbi:MAG: hypothetical protein COA77_00490 [Thaumarchaeota archaeon]|nr:MAG: hypothetical protein COA77_00490 [Nitrososphaerota archaeon]
MIKAGILALEGEINQSSNLLENVINLDSSMAELAKTEGAFLILRNSDIFRTLFRYGYTDMIL